MKIITSIVITLSLLFSLSVSATELNERAVIKNKVMMLFLEERFDDLEALAEQYRNEQIRTSSGLWKLTIFYYGIKQKIVYSKGMNDDEYRQYINGIADRWLEKYPRAPTPYIVKGMLLQGQAWSTRRKNKAIKSKKETRKLLLADLEKAKAYLLQVRQTASVDPHWYEVMSRLDTSLSVDKAEFLQRVNEGLTNTPEYYQLYFSAIDYLTPRSHGSKEMIEEFANAAVERTKSSEGMGMYARIYWYASQTEYDLTLFTQSNVNWDRMKQGIDDVLAEYPDSWNINNFAFFSCLSGDQDKTKSLIDQIVGVPIKRAWKHLEIYNRCNEWANSEI